MSKLSNLVKNRGFVRARITKLCNKIRDECESFASDEVPIYLGKCTALQGEVTSLDKTIYLLQCETDLTEEQHDVLVNEGERYMEMLSVSITTLNNLNVVNLNENFDSIASSDNFRTANFVPNKLKMPQIPLPQFSNKKGENLLNFFRAFEAIVNKQQLTSYEKFIYLKKQVENSPRILLESLDISNHNYDKAKELLMQAFDNTDQSKQEIIEKLSSLKLSPGTDPYIYVGEVRSIISSFESLKINTNDVLAYFVWTGFNNKFQNILTNITNKSRPSLEDINMHIFDATTRYLKDESENKFRNKTYSERSPKFETNSHAMNVGSSNSKKFCGLCSNDKKSNDHFMIDCKAYPTNSDKFTKLRNMKGCTQCGFVNHDTKSCKFQFKSNCRYCDMPHKSYLCLKYKSKYASGANATAIGNDSSSVTEIETQNQYSYVEAYPLHFKNDMILPTLTGYITGENYEAKIRIFKDGGCQQTFIDSSVAKSLNLPVITDNIVLTIHGFNTSRKVSTKLVKLNLKLGDQIFPHEAICIDDIRTQFSVEGVGKLVKKFHEKGYTMADTKFTPDTDGVVNDIDCTLGTDADHLLAMCYKTFGETSEPHTLSSYIETPQGVVLSGSLSRMIKNAEYLPSMKNKSVHVQRATDVNHTENNYSSVCTTKNNPKLPACARELDSVCGQNYSYENSSYVVCNDLLLDGNSPYSEINSCKAEPSGVYCDSEGKTSKAEPSGVYCDLEADLPKSNSDEHSQKSLDLNDEYNDIYKMSSNIVHSSSPQSVSGIEAKQRYIEVPLVEQITEHKQPVAMSESGIEAKQTYIEVPLVEQITEHKQPVAMYPIGDEITEPFLELNISNNSSTSFHEGDECPPKSEELLDSELHEYLDTHVDFDDDLDTETNGQLIKFILENTSRAADGRLKMPLPWNNKNAHLLSNNYYLARKVLESNFQKLNCDQTKLKMYDDVFRQQEELKVIERINDLDTFLLEHPEASFLAHTGVFRMSHESTKCRVVFMSNLCDKRNNGVSHNMAMFPGPNLNHKLSNAVLLNRFDKYMLIFDIKKAFLNIELYEHDQNRLCFLWYRNIAKEDFTLIGYRNLRLSFGLRASPSILMLALNKILILDKCGDEKLDSLKRSIFNTVYMDNGSVSFNSSEELTEAYNFLEKIFSPYHFTLQQFGTNSDRLQSEIDAETGEKTLDSIKFFGITWDRVNDSLYPLQIKLDSQAKTKRSILSSLNSIYDIFNIYAPILLRAKLFMQRLQCSDFGWDMILPNALQSEWGNIVSQANGSPVISIPRCVGRRSSSYALIAFTDASKEAFGAVLYIKDLETGLVSFLVSKNKLIPTTSKRTIPALELQAISFGVNLLHEQCDALSGPTVVEPTKVTQLYLYSDSMVCLHWMQSYSIYFDKLQKISIFVKNRLAEIDKQCNKKSVVFRHICGTENPADKVSRPTSYKVLSRSSYLTGPDFLANDLNQGYTDLELRLPDPRYKTNDEVPHDLSYMSALANVTRTVDSDSISVSTSLLPTTTVDSDSFSLQSTPIGEQKLVTMSTNVESQTLLNSTTSNTNDFLPINRYSNLKFLVNVLANVFRFIDILKRKIANKTSTKFENLSNEQIHAKSVSYLISRDQKVNHGNVFDYFSSTKKNLKDIPDITNQLNLYLGQDGVLRVKSKFLKNENSNPVFLPKDSWLTELIIRETREQMSHAGIYSCIRRLRKKFFIEKMFSSVKRILKTCIICRKINKKPVKLSQNAYRDFRVNPPKIPFSSVMLDYIGPFSVTTCGKKTKVYLLAITDLFSRACNLKICRDATIKEFLRALQLHCFEYGLFKNCVSDLGSQLQSGANTLRTFLSDYQTRNFLSQQGIKEISFQHYAKGNSSLGSLIESMVKQVKYLIYKSIGKVILDYFEFEYVVCKTVNLINKRPIGFKDGLRTLGPDEMPEVITPELILKGYEPLSFNVIPDLQPDQDDYLPDGSVSLEDSYNKLRSVREKLIDTYHADFLTNLIHQATDQKDRYKPVSHEGLSVGDLVLLIDKNQKRYNYPMGRILNVEVNTLGEVTSARVFKGDTREIVYRHSTSLIPILSVNEYPADTGDNSNVDYQFPDSSKNIGPERQKLSRNAAVACRAKIKNLARQDNI